MTLDLDRLRTQRIVLSDGSTFTALTTSPKPFVVQTKDVRTSNLWSKTVTVDDGSGKMAQFASRFSMDSKDTGILDAGADFFGGGRKRKTAKAPKTG